jgi:hypothetical protein
MAKQNKEILDYQRATFMFDQRPWLSVFKIELMKQLESPGTFQVKFWYKNTGKTPALKTTSNSKILFADEEPSYTPFPVKFTPASQSIVLPGDDRNHAIHDGTVSGTLDTYQKRQRRMYLHARIVYADIFSEQHVTYICAYHLADESLDTWRFCTANNDMY